MNICLNETNFSLDNLQFLETKHNMIMNGLFTKIIYSEHTFTMNGIYLLFPIQLDSIKNNVAYFDIKDEFNQHCIRRFSDLEDNILTYYKDFFYRHDNKIVTHLSKQLRCGYFKLNHHTHEPFTFSIDKPCLLKIAGVWLNGENLGLTYKFLQCDLFV